MFQCSVYIRTVLNLDVKVCDTEGVAAVGNIPAWPLKVTCFYRFNLQSEPMLFDAVCSTHWCCPSAPLDHPGVFASRQSDVSEEESGRGAGLQ